MTGMLVGFRPDWLGREETMKIAGRGTQNRYAIVRSQASVWGGRLEKILLNYVGWKIRNIPSTGEVSSLTFPFRENLPGA